MIFMLVGKYFSIKILMNIGICIMSLLCDDLKSFKYYVDLCNTSLFEFNSIIPYTKANKLFALK